MKRLLLSATQGDVVSQFNVGVIYDNAIDDNDHDTKRSRGEAIKWLRRSARQGLARAQVKLAEVYADGTGAPGDLVKACGWFLLAATNLVGAHRQKARSGFERVSSNLTPAEVARAYHFAGLWQLKERKRAPDIKGEAPIARRLGCLQ